MAPLALLAFCFLLLFFFFLLCVLVLGNVHRSRTLLDSRAASGKQQRIGILVEIPVQLQKIFAGTELAVQLKRQIALKRIRAMRVDEHVECIVAVADWRQMVTHAAVGAVGSWIELRLADLDADTIGVEKPSSERQPVWTQSIQKKLGTVGMKASKDLMATCTCEELPGGAVAFMSGKT